MYLTSAEGYKNTKVDAKIARETGKTRVNMKNVERGMGVKNMSDLVLKGIHGRLEIKYPTKKQNSKYERTKIEIYKKFGNLSKDKWNTKCNKNVYVRNDVIIKLLLLNGADVKKQRS